MKTNKNHFYAVYNEIKNTLSQFETKKVLAIEYQTLCVSLCAINLWAQSQEFMLHGERPTTDTITRGFKCFPSDFAYWLKTHKQAVVYLALQNWITKSEPGFPDGGV